jgi:hypothetical protein
MIYTSLTPSKRPKRTASMISSWKYSQFLFGRFGSREMTKSSVASTPLSSLGRPTFAPQSS